MNPDSEISLADMLRAQGDIPVVSGPTYPALSACWMCGTMVPGGPTTALRRCDNGHEMVTWHEKLAGTNPPDWRPLAPEVTTSSPA